MSAPFIGLTGNIGSGKSTVSARWALRGARVLDADAISRRLRERDGECYGAVISAFPGVLCADGSVDRKALGGIVFSDEAARAQLNAIVHPAVCARMLAAGADSRRAEPARCVVFDVPLLFECGLDRSMDKNVLVYASDSIRLERIIARDGCSLGEAVRRMASQQSQIEKCELADLVIDNDGDLARLYAQADAMYDAFSQSK